MQLYTFIFYDHLWLEVLRCFRYWPGNTLETPFRQEINPSASTSIRKEPVKVIPSCTICLIQPWQRNEKSGQQNETKKSSKMGFMMLYVHQSLSIVYYSPLIYYSTLLLEVDRYVVPTCSSTDAKEPFAISHGLQPGGDLCSYFISWRCESMKESCNKWSFQVIFGSNEIHYSRQLRLQELPILPIKLLLEIQKCIVFKTRQFRILQGTSHGKSHEFSRQSASSTEVPRAYCC